ncbi:hypothetical protein J6590_032388 [Homalodisca vitripennis]|nr:hypothetical protein J6590_032388 [Homalodisca vitripennis]
MERQYKETKTLSWVNEFNSETESMWSCSRNEIGMTNRGKRKLFMFNVNLIPRKHQIHFTHKIHNLPPAST